MALHFDGTDDKVGYGDLAGIDSAAALTVMAWINPDTVVPARQVLVAKSTGAVIAVLFELADNDIKIWHTGGGETGVTSVNLLVAGTWTHVASVFDGSGAANADRQKLYIDGINRTLTFAGTIPSALGDGGANALEVGAGSGAAGTTFYDGKLAFPRIWTAALGPQEILAEMHNWRARRTQNLLIGAPYDDLTAAEDFSGNRNHGTVTGALQVPGPPVPYGAPD